MDCYEIEHTGLSLVKSKDRYNKHVKYASRNAPINDTDPGDQRLESRM